MLKYILPVLLIPIAFAACEGSVSTGSSNDTIDYVHNVKGWPYKSILFPSGNKGEVLENKDTLEFRSSKKDTTISIVISMPRMDTIRHKYVAPPVAVQPPPVDTTISPAPGTRQNLILDANFDGSNPFTGFTLSNGQYCCSYSITQVTAPDGGVSGKSLRYELRSTDVIVSSSKRAEIQLAGTDAPQESERWYGLRYWLQKYDYDDGRESIIQWHDGDGTTPPLSLQVGSGTFTIMQSFTTGNIPTDIGPTVTGRWIPIVIHVKWTTGTTGILEVWKDGKKVVSKTNVRTNSKGGSYMKIGINKWSWAPGGGTSSTTQRIFYIDDFRMGNDKARYEDVAP